MSSIKHNNDKSIEIRVLEARLQYKQTRFLYITEWYQDYTYQSLDSIPPEILCLRERALRNLRQHKERK